jgi:hypothetical protein
MTKKDYAIIAEVNKDMIGTYGANDPRLMSNVIRQCFTFRRDNARFDAAVFLRASGYSDADVSSMLDALSW